MTVDVKGSDIIMTGHAAVAASGCVVFVAGNSVTSKGYTVVTAGSSSVAVTGSGIIARTDAITGVAIGDTWSAGGR